ncbi:hypothetical protein M422DRAFT_53372 [Sphaerobolus stellatus SS14]|uniref:Autophagy-related protein n=1 Tax=Sphaerobolus stellatus (strain SS14) TaxID=990650 RepID=A0A0C9V1L6_SPHS4|nr:hypothetical protein M422DRAFT_53372 [Sphaerobolus stellatus SS14]
MSQCLLPWGNGTRSVSSVALIANGVSFAIKNALFTTTGSAADYGSFRGWLLVVTIICWGAQFADLIAPDKWELAMALFKIGFVSYGATLVFYTAAFPRLARNTPRARKLDQGELTIEEYEIEESLEKNGIGSISNAHDSIGYLLTLTLNLSLLIPLQNNPKVDNYKIAL